MLRKLISKIKNTFKAGGKSAESKPAHGHRAHAAKPAGKGGQRHERTERGSSGGQRQSHGGGHARSEKSHGRGHERSERHERSSPARGEHHERKSHAPAHRAPRHEEAAKPLPEVPKMDTAFTALGLNDRLAYGVQQMGYENPTPIQAQAIPQVLAGKDVIGSAQTGTGKTAAFALP
ncbi:MAG TPA: DEAD/DEAH box helicase, partial [Acidobacteriota bacterium]|nr:DEAD/DEAH box helicase [Acidobacteriota bacterium]